MGLNRQNLLQLQKVMKNDKNKCRNVQSSGANLHEMSNRVFLLFFFFGVGRGRGGGGGEISKINQYVVCRKNTQNAKG